MAPEDAAAHTFHLVDEIFYGEGARENMGVVKYALPAKKGEARLYAKRGAKDVFTYFASIALLAPTEVVEGGYKAAIEATWTAKQTELVEYLDSDATDLKEQVEWWNDDTKTLQKALDDKYDTKYSPKLKLMEDPTKELVEELVEEVPAEELVDPTSVDKQRIQGAVRQQKTAINKLGKIDNIYMELQDLGVENSTLGSIDSALDTIQATVDSDPLAQARARIQFIKKLLRDIGRALNEISDAADAATLNGKKILELVARLEEEAI